MNDWPLISITTFLPMAGAIVLALWRGCPANRLWTIAVVTSALPLFPVVWMGLALNTGTGALQFSERHAWIPSLSVDYYVAVDGLSLVLLLLTALVVPMALLTSRSVISARQRGYVALVLLLQSGLFGTFSALNFFHWFLFWELSLVPAYFLVRCWGGAPGRAAAFPFFLFTMVGSIAMLVGFMGLYLKAGTLDLVVLAETGAASGPGAGLIFFCVLLGLAVKVPMMPFHAWLPATYTAAPSPVTMLLTGVMSKMGVYGLLRILLPIFPEQIRQWWIPLVALAVMTIVFSAWAALVQQDVKRMLAYSSVNHLGYCLLAVFVVAAHGGDGPGLLDSVAAIHGVVLQVFNHGITAAALFACVAFLERRSGGRRGIDEFGGLRSVAPAFCGWMGFCVFASLGLPGLNGFVGEFLMFKGVYGLSPWAAVAAVPGLLLTALFLLNWMQRVFHGPLNDRWKAFPDLSSGEQWILAPALALILILGVAPGWFVRCFDASVLRWINALTGGGG